eukprot:202077-Hanusia_phi.AAC.1
MAARPGASPKRPDSIRLRLSVRRLKLDQCQARGRELAKRRALAAAAESDRAADSDHRIPASGAVNLEGVTVE